jgi:peroxiredoxin
MTLPLYAQEVGTAAPDFTVDLLAGTQFTLSEQSGKVVLVYFFGNSCPYCIAAGPSVDAIYTDHQLNPDFIAVGLDTWNASSNAETVAGFASSAEVSFPLAIKAGAVATAYGTTYDRLAVIDQDGILRHKGSAAASNDTENAREVIEGLLTTTTIDVESGRKTDLALYPNPVAAELRFRLHAEGAGTTEIRIVDMAGHQVKKQLFDHHLGEQEFVLDLSEQQDGIYLYRIFREDRVDSGKIILQK